MAALIGLLIIIVPLWRICQRAGLNPVISLIAIVPFLGLWVVAGILAFAPWPALKSRLSGEEV